jgi:hypothetical protein
VVGYLKGFIEYDSSQVFEKAEEKKRWM